MSGAGEVWVTMTDARYLDAEVVGEFALRQGQNAIQTFRSGFGLAVASARSSYGFGGLVDLSVLQPTAGREALTTESMQLLQETLTALDAAVSLAVADTAAADQSTAFMSWVSANGRYDLCGRLRARLEPGGRTIALSELRERSQTASVLVYAGSDRALIGQAASDDVPLVVLATSNPRRQCEAQFLAAYCRTEALTDAPTVLSEKPPESWSLAEQALAFRIVSILESDYFLATDVGLGALSHGLPIVTLTDRQPVRIVIDPTSATFGAMTQLYDTDYAMFGSMAKDYIRNVIFPRVADLVPSSTRQGAEAFLKSIRRTRDVFEYEVDDLGSLTSIWEKYLAGDITMGEAAERSISATKQSVQVFDAGGTRRVAEVVPDVAAAEAVIGGGDVPGPGPAPPIVRMEVETAAKLLVVDEGEDPIYGHRCFIAISSRAREERGDFFLQPHSTSVVWGGQKVLFVFEHHSGEFGLYYDLQASHVVASASGGGAVPTATMVLGNRIFIPVPDAVAAAFVPDVDERKRFEVRCDLLYTDAPPAPRVMSE
jgi:molecular chaperone HtpG